MFNDLLETIIDRVGSVKKGGAQSIL
jgi:hypothetical protein